ncbi:MAG: FAD-dependent oxidoreductase [Kiritimatiellae bacterium]|jgi:hypothetical protein|nr:FAD-dependent oxidoreductase [Kiritimatiellia bacterium]
MKRRDFLALSGVVAVSPTLIKSSTGTALTATGATVREPAKDLPIKGSYDVVVSGGGPAGAMAAIAAGRKGAKTLLIEQHGCLGGIWTSGLLAYILDYQNKAGLMKEFITTLRERNAHVKNDKGGYTSVCDIEACKILLEEMCAEAGVEIAYHTRTTATLKSGRKISHILTESKSGREAVTASNFIDTTGDGDLGFYAGCNYDFGHPESKLTQPMSLICLVAGINAKDVQDFYRDGSRGLSWSLPKSNLRKAMEAGGVSPSYGSPSLFRMRDDLFLLMSNHEYKVMGTKAEDVTTATLRARKELNAQINALRSTGGVWENIMLVATAEQIGVREGRRLKGLYTVSDDDIRTGRRFEDGICPVTFGIDVHSLDPDKTKSIEGKKWHSKPYDIPMRSLIAADVDNLLFAGRCISGGFLPHSSYRVTGNAAAMGEAAGKAAAIAAAKGIAPAKVPFKEVKG